MTSGKTLRCSNSLLCVVWQRSFENAWIFLARGSPFRLGASYFAQSANQFLLQCSTQTLAAPATLSGATAFLQCRL